MKKGLLLALVMSSLSGCSLLPYHDSDACKLEGNYGKCIDGQSAYDEAVSGKEMYGNYIVEDGLTDEMPEAVKQQTKSAEGSGDGFIDNHLSVAEREYIGLRAKTYQELSTLVDNPQTPLVRPTKVLTTLIIGYRDSSDKKHMYSPRYVYTIAKEPEFVLDNAKQKKTDSTMDVLNFLNATNK